MSIARVNQTPKTLATGGSTAKTVTIPALTAGNTVFLLAGCQFGSGLSSIAATGVTWTKVIASATLTDAELWAGVVVTGGATTVTITVANTYATYDVTVLEYAGLAATLTTDGTPTSAAASTGGTGACPTGTITPTTGDAVLVLAVVCATTAITAGPTGGFTSLSTTGTSGVTGFASQIVTSATGGYATSYTSSGTFNHYNSQIAAFAGATGGGGFSGSSAARAVNEGGGSGGISAARQVNGA